MYNIEGALPYVYIHEDLDQDLYSEVKKLYKEKSDLDVSEHRLLISERMTRVGDVVWALKRSATLREMGKSEWKQYFDLAEERRKVYQENFGC